MAEGRPDRGPRCLPSVAGTATKFVRKPSGDANSRLPASVVELRIHACMRTRKGIVGEGHQELPLSLSLSLSANRAGAKRSSQKQGTRIRMEVAFCGKAGCTRPMPGKSPHGKPAWAVIGQRGG